MADFVPWVSPDVSVRMLTPATGAFAFSPDDARLAWVEGDGAVRVTELDSSRTVATLDGDRVSALEWTSPETLRVLRRAGGDATLHVHALPDGGELARVALPGVGVRPLSIASSVGGRAALVGRESWGWPPSRQPEVTWLVRGELGESVTRFDPYALAEAGLRERIHVIRCAMNPDGGALAVASGAAGPGAGNAARVAFVDVATGSSTAHALPERADPTVVSWVSPSRVLVASLDAKDLTVIETIDALGERVEVARLAPLEMTHYDAPLDLHPDRGRFVIEIERLRERRGDAILAAVLRIPEPGAPPVKRELILLSESSSGDRPTRRGGGACWDAAGRLIVLTHPRPGEARLTRRDHASSSPHTLAHFALTGERPHELSLHPSPRRTRAAAAWLTLDRGPAERVRRLALIEL